MNNKAKLVIPHGERSVLLKSSTGENIYEGGVKEVIKLLAFMGPDLGKNKYYAAIEGTILVDGNVICFTSSDGFDSVESMVVEIDSEIRKVSFNWPKNSARDKSV